MNKKGAQLHLQHCKIRPSIFIFMQDHSNSWSWAIVAIIGGHVYTRILCFKDKLYLNIQKPQGKNTKYFFNVF